MHGDEKKKFKRVMLQPEMDKICERDQILAGHNIQHLETIVYLELAKRRL